METRRGAIASTPSFLHAFGWSLALLVGVEAITGTALAAFYSPSTTDAWASLAYVQDRVAWGWLVRGLHVHSSSAIVIVAGLHLVAIVLRGGYQRPREITWWTGLILMLLVLGFAVSGYVLRWDQPGFWANHVEVNIAASTPVVGSLIQALALGGNEYGNLTLTRFYALHVIVLPAICAAITLAHIALARRHGPSPVVRVPRPDGDGGASRPPWADQSVRNLIAMAMVSSAVVAYTVSQHGADLGAPADPASAYDARPLWYFRWLFELRHLAGPLESFAALAAPGVVLGFLAVLPLVDRSPLAPVGSAAAPAGAGSNDRGSGRPEGSPLGGRDRRGYIAAVLGIMAIIIFLTISSFVRDANDDALGVRQDKAAQRASRARALAVTNGVPVTGPLDIYTAVPMYRPRALFTQYCKDCHDAGSDKRKGPIIGPGHGNRAWLKGFLVDPSGSAYYGRTKLVHTENAMKPVTMSAAQLDDLTELLYAQSGATDVDAAKRIRGQTIFDEACTDCHSLDEGVGGGSGPGLGALGSRDYYVSYISNPGRAAHMASMAEMPRFDRELSIVDRDALAGYLVWLRTATQRDLDLLGPL
jgi:ubiquinol-cytochrome c reductase cytochrome b subunit